MQKQLFIFFLAMGSLITFSIGALPDKSETVVIKTAIIVVTAKSAKVVAEKSKETFHLTKEFFKST